MLPQVGRKGLAIIFSLVSREGHHRPVVGGLPTPAFEFPLLAGAESPDSQFAGCTKWWHPPSANSRASLRPSDVRVGLHGR